MTTLVKNGGRSFMIWGSFAAFGFGQFAIVDGKMNSEVYQGKPQDDAGVSVHQLKFHRSWLM